MKYLLSTALLFFMFQGMAQVIQVKDFALDIGVEGGYYNTKWDTNIFGVDSSYSDTAATFFVPFHIEYMVTHKIGLGLVLKSGNYLTDRSNEENKARVLAVSASYHPFVTHKIDIYTRLGIGAATLKTTDIGIVVINADYSGSAFEIDAGIKVYFSEHFGLNFGLGYNNYSFKLQSYSIAGVDVDLTEVEWNLGVSGVEVGAGLAFKF